MSRIKSVFSSDEIAHVWVHIGAPRGRRSDGNMSFAGPAFYSYRTVIGRILKTKGGAPVYLLDTHHFSNSTSKHYSHMRRAIPGDATMFHVNSGKMGQSLNMRAGDLRDYYLNLYRTPTVRSSSRYAHIRAEDVQWRISRLSEAIRVCQVFGLAHAKLDKELAGAQVKLNAANEVCRAAKVKSDAQSVARKATERADKVKRAISKAEEIVAAGVLPEGERINMEAISLLDSRPDLKTAIESMVNAKNQAAMDAWRAGGGTVGQPSHEWPTLLRVDGDDMQTSKGVRVPLTEAHKAYLFAMLKRSDEWRRNGETFGIGMYQLDSVTSEGIVAGCHRISWAEVDRFASVMGWASTPIVNA